MKTHDSQHDPEKLSEGTLVSHLVELRSRLMRSMLAVAVIFVALVPFAQQVYTTIANPLQQRLEEAGWSMITIDPAAPFLVPFKTTLFVALFLAMPVVLYQIWQFIAPGLYRNERRFAFPLLVSSILLFYAGMAFAYYVVFPLMFTFFIAFTPEGVMMYTDINSYLSFVLTIFFAFGIAFEVPIATVMLVWSGLTTVRTLSRARPYIFLGAFVIGMFLTPPDMISQTLLAVPIYILYESGLILCRIMLPEKVAAETAEESPGET